MKPVKMSLVCENGEYDVTVTIGDEEFDLGIFDDAKDAALRMSRWVSGRGLVFAPDSARRIGEAQRNNSTVLILDVVKEDNEAD